MIVIIDNTIGKRKRFFNLLVNYMEKSERKYKIIETMDDYSDIFDEENNNVKCIILSGSDLMYDQLKQPKYEQKRKILQSVLDLKTHIPIIGICFGAQYINEYFKGTLFHLDHELCKKKQISWTKRSKKLDWDTKNTKFQFCLNWLPDKVGKNLEIIATLDSLGKREIPVLLKHKTYSVFALLFHPEHDEKGHEFLNSLLLSIENKDNT